jgi:glucose-6-phosphate 1-dehydrogenase
MNQCLNFRKHPASGHGMIKDIYEFEALPDMVLANAYERLLMDPLKDDASLFARTLLVIEASWRLMNINMGVIKC